jgi:primary-amine oxidase
MSSPHPLDPASAEEYLAGRDILVAAGLLAEPVRFAYYGLEEAAKNDVLAGAASDRRLRAYLVNTDTGESTDALVSLTHAKVVSARTLDPARDGQLPILDSDFARVDEITKADPDWQAAMARRGYTDLSGRVRAPRGRPAADGPGAGLRHGA